MYWAVSCLPRQRGLWMHCPSLQQIQIYYLGRGSDKSITTVKRAIFSIFRAILYLEYAEDNAYDCASMSVSWYCVAGYDHVRVTEWAHQRGYSRRLEFPSRL